MCCTRLAEHTGCKQSPKNRHLGTITQLRWAICLQLRHVSTIEKKLVKHQYLLHMSPQYGELRPTSSWDLLASLGHPTKFQRVSRLGFVTAATSLNGSQPNFACLTVSWAGTVYIHFRGFLPRDRILPGAIFTLHPSLALPYNWQCYSMALEKWSSAKLCGFEQRAPPTFGRVAITLGIGRHSS